MPENLKDKKDKLTTIAIYKKDIEELDKIMKRGERYRDKIHELIIKEKGAKQWKEKKTHHINYLT